MRRVKADPLNGCADHRHKTDETDGAADGGKRLPCQLGQARQESTSARSGPSGLSLRVCGHQTPPLCRDKPRQSKECWLEPITVAEALSALSVPFVISDRPLARRVWRSSCGHGACASHPGWRSSHLVAPRNGGRRTRRAAASRRGRPPPTDDRGKAVTRSSPPPISTAHGAFMEPWVVLYNGRPRLGLTEMGVAKCVCCFQLSTHGQGLLVGIKNDAMKKKKRSNSNTAKMSRDPTSGIREKEKRTKKRAIWN